MGRVYIRDPHTWPPVNFLSDRNGGVTVAKLQKVKKLLPSIPLALKLANIFCKEPCNQYPKPCGPVVFLAMTLVCCRAAMDSAVSGCG